MSEIIETRNARPRVLYYSHDAVGLGHLSRVTVIAQALASRRADVVSLIVTGAANPFAFPLPRNTDLVRLPVAGRAHLYRSLPPAADLPGVSFTDSGLWQLRARILEATAVGFAPDILCVDHQPEGVYGELLPAIRQLKLANPDAKLVAVLDDFMDDPAVVAERWRSEGIDILRSTYDQVIIRGDRDVFASATVYDFPPDLLAKTSYSGYVVRRPAGANSSTTIRARHRIDERPLVVVSTGSGRDGQHIVRTFIEALHASGTPEFHSIVVTGLAMPETDRRDIALNARSIPRLTLVPFLDDLPGYINAADLVVTMAGYSTMAEVLSLGKRALVIPRVKPWPEQRLRAERLAELGLVTMLLPDNLTPERIWTAILTALSSPLPAKTVDCSGAERIAGQLSALLGPRT